MAELIVWRALQTRKKQVCTFFSLFMFPFGLYLFYIFCILFVRKKKKKDQNRRTDFRKL